MGSSKRDRLIDTALALFCREGFQATGIDRIIAESGVAKMTLYRHFRSKDELILAAMRRRDEEFRNWLVRAVEARAATPEERLLAIFDVLEEWFATDGFSGCLFINAAAELGEKADAVRALAAEHKRLIGRYVRGLVEAAGIDRAAPVAEWLCLLIEGAIVTAQVAGRPAIARAAREAAQVLIERAAAAGSGRVG